MTLEQKDLRRMLETAIVAARLAGQRAMEDIDFVSFSVKNSNELVTPSDYRCQQIIVERIKESYPDHGFIGEEQSDQTILRQPPRGGEPVWWIIDPIDGTNNFAHKLPVFTVSIAALHNGEPIVGVIFEPATESMFTAVKGADAQLNGRRITASDEKTGRLTSVGIDSHFSEPTPNWIIEIMKRTRFRNFGTAALQFAYVASGGLVGTIAASARLWDFAAGALICTTAGAKVTDFAGKSVFPVDPDSYQGQPFELLAAGAGAYDELLEIIGS